MSSFLEKYKEFQIEYSCELCQKMNFFIEDVKQEIIRVKNDSCEHFAFKFIFNYEGEIRNCILSIKCKICQKNIITETLFDNQKQNDLELETHKLYICENCNNGPLTIQLFLIKEDLIKEINIIFTSYKGKEYKLKVAQESILSEVFTNLCQNNEELEINKVRGLAYNDRDLDKSKSLLENGIYDGYVITILYG